MDKVFTYRIPPHLSIEVGHRVLVPFGARKIEGYVISKTPYSDIEPSRVRDILRALDPDPIIRPPLVALAQWMSHEYVGLLSEALQFMLPPGGRYGKERVGFKKQQLVQLRQPNPQLPPRAAAQQRVVDVLQAKGAMLAAKLVDQAETSYSTLRALEEKGIIKISVAQIERSIEWDVVPEQTVVLTEAQTKACQAVQEELQGSRRPVLIHGVTGSGKTEVYLRLISKVLQNEKQALVLVPEISLTPQTVSRFGTRFGERIAVLHSGLSEGERFDQWWRIYRGDVDVVIGARSAVFAPLSRLGLIVMDEEHEGTYKQEDGTVRYHARAVAEQRARLSEAVLVLGSATPALESYHAAVQGKYKLVELPDRVESRPLPAVETVDMRAEFDAGNRSMFSERLRVELTETLAHNNQAIILLNRRGFSSFVLCRECGHVMRCPNCSVSMTYHKADDKLHCHYCTLKQNLPAKCPECASPYLRQFGVGTEQLQAYVRETFPQARTIRMDADTTRRKGAHRTIFNRFASGEANVLIGTQMVAKGLDFPNVTLVGVLAADMALNFPDIRASERTFQLLTQVAGRAGRGEKPGKVIIQCYTPEHFAVQAAKGHDYQKFFRQEISFRREMGYPPFRCLTRILCSGPEAPVRKHCQDLAQYLKSKGLPQEDLFGPAPAPIAKIKGRSRWQLIFKMDVLFRIVLRDMPPSPEEVHVAIDVDPLFLL